MLLPQEQEMAKDLKADRASVKGRQGYAGASRTQSVDFLPRSELDTLQEYKDDEPFLGDGQHSTGAVVILDMVLGCCYSLGTLTDPTLLAEFLRAYERGELRPRPIRMLRAEEELDPAMLQLTRKDRLKKKREEQRSASAAQDTKAPDELPRRMPCVVAWMLNAQHVAAGVSPDFLYRAMLKQAYLFTPTNDDAVRVNMAPHEVLTGLFPGRRSVDKYERRIQRFLLFGDDSIQGDVDAEDGQFSQRLRGFVERIINEDAKGSRKDLRETNLSLLQEADGQDSDEAEESESDDSGDGGVGGDFFD